MDPSFGRLEYANARHASMLRQAEVERALHDGAAPSPAAGDTLLARLGDALGATGERLQERRPAPASATALLPAEALADPSADQMPALALHFYQYADGRIETRVFCRLLDPRDGSRVTALLQGVSA
jgi:pyrroloquinoline quinone (PQQ) biosynthesis protein C